MELAHTATADRKPVIASTELLENAGKNGNNGTAGFVLFGIFHERTEIKEEVVGRGGANNLA